MRHDPVLLAEVIDALALAPDKNIIDCTLGDGGHTEEIVKRIAPDGQVLGIDADPESLARSKNFLHEYDGRVVFVRDNFEHIDRIVPDLHFGPIDGILMDLGWSSPQFAERDRGFSFENPDEPLDMRFDAGAGENKRATAADILNTQSVDALEDIFHRYGEESHARKIAEAIVEQRKTKMFTTVGDLIEAVLGVYRVVLRTDKEVPWIGGNHPATQSFQALRIAVNDELGVLERVLPKAVEVLGPHGRLAVITFHSLEDRIVKHFFKSQEGKTVTLISKKPIVPSDVEVERNVRARSAKLRVVQKI